MIANCFEIDNLQHFECFVKEGDFFAWLRALGQEISLSLSQSLFLAGFLTSKTVKPLRLLFAGCASDAFF
jgi:hypothetical protein